MITNLNNQIQQLQQQQQQQPGQKGSQKHSQNSFATPLPPPPPDLSRNSSLRTDEDVVGSQSNLVNMYDNDELLDGQGGVRGGDHHHQHDADSNGLSSPLGDEQKDGGSSDSFTEISYPTSEAPNSSASNIKNPQQQPTPKNRSSQQQQRDQQQSNQQIISEETPTPFMMRKLDHRRRNHHVEDGNSDENRGKGEEGDDFVHVNDKYVLVKQVSLYFCFSFSLSRLIFLLLFSSCKNNYKN